MHWMDKQAVFIVQWGSVVHPLMPLPLLVLKGGILQRGIQLVVFVLLGTTALLLLLLPCLFDVLTDTMLI